MKTKVAISIDAELLLEIDEFAKKTLNGSRSQAITYFVRKGMEQKQITTAVLLYHKKHLPLAVQNLSGKPLLTRQLDWLSQNGITRLFLVTGNADTEQLTDIIARKDLEVRIIQKDEPGNAGALLNVKSLVPDNLLVMSGDILPSGNLATMMSHHINGHRLATIGLMTRDHAGSYGVCELDGDLIMSFTEKPKKSESHVVNMGLYLFDAKIFRFIEQPEDTIERQLLPRLASLRLLFGYFLSGKMEHMG